MQNRLKNHSSPKYKAQLPQTAKSLPYLDHCFKKQLTGCVFCLRCLRKLKIFYRAHKHVTFLSALCLSWWFRKDVIKSLHHASSHVFCLFSNTHLLSQYLYLKQLKFIQFLDCFPCLLFIVEDLTLLGICP